RRQHDWIFRLMRESAVAPNAVNNDIYGVHVCQGKARCVADASSRNLGVVMQCEAKIRARKATEQSVREHGARASATLLGRLSDYYQSSVPLVLKRRQDFCRSQDAGHIHVMATGM